MSDDAPSVTPGDETPLQEPEVVAEMTENPAPPFGKAQDKETPQPEQALEPERAQLPVVEPFPPKTEPINEPQLQGSPLAPQTVPATNILREMLATARAVFQNRKRKKLDKILTLLTTEKTISGGDVQKLLRVSKPTATRYLNLLEKEGKIIQVGAKGRGVLYVKAH